MAVTDWTAELLLFAGVAGWILYELYGRRLFEIVSSWSMYLRMAGGALVVLYLYWQFKNRPDEFTTDTLGFAKELIGAGAGAGTGSGTGAGREKRNVTALMKKRIAASQSWKCGLCTNTLDETYEVDHRIALFNGGSNDPSNLVALCPHCHRKKTVDARLV